MDNDTVNKPVILASSSPYRWELLARLGFAFEWASPQCDESPHRDETFPQLAQRLARQKAEALARDYPNHLIIGSDQVGICQGKQLTKPGNTEIAVQQLLLQSGQEVTFHTAVAVLNSHSGYCLTDSEITRIQFRQLSEASIRSYLTREQPFDCAGAFKAEGLGISLFKTINSDEAPPV